MRLLSRFSGWGGNRKTRYIGLLLAAVLLSFVVYLCRDVLLLAVGNYLIVADAIQPCDLIHVIAGPDYRTDYAIKLYHEHYARLLFFTGGWCTINNYYHGAHARERSINQGVPADAIVVDESSVDSTYSEAERLKQFIAHSPRPVQSIIVVSDPYHMRRARWVYAHLLDHSIRVQMAPVPMEKTGYKTRWWSDRESQNYVLDEYRKMAYYVARYQLAFGQMKSWLASLDTD